MNICGIILCSLLAKHYGKKVIILLDEYFGFTDKEVKEMLEYYGLSEHYDTMKEWYDGYLFGDTDIYCPWDVINYCDLLRSDPSARP